MERVTKNNWCMEIAENITALIGAVWGMDLNRIIDKLNNFSENAIQYTNDKLNAGRKVEKMTSQTIRFRILDDNSTSRLDLNKGICYKHNCLSGNYLIIHFEAEGDCRSHTCIYAISKTGK